MWLVKESEPVSVPYEITLLSNDIEEFITNNLFQYLMKLHYSQTFILILLVKVVFQYLMKLHYSQTGSRCLLAIKSFSTL